MDKKLAQSIGTAARAARRAMRLTQEDAAERIGVSAEFYARIERGNALPSIPTMARICSSLGVSADALIGRVEMIPLGGSQSRWAPPQASDSPEVRRLTRRLRRASPATLRLVTLLVKELESRD
ncbi:MAG: helix-turn-helix transcriptional regulator [Myxococcota bacterium]